MYVYLTCTCVHCFTCTPYIQQQYGGHGHFACHIQIYHSHLSHFCKSHTHYNYLIISLDGISCAWLLVHFQPTNHICKVPSGICDLMWMKMEKNMFSSSQRVKDSKAKHCYWESWPFDCLGRHVHVLACSSDKAKVKHQMWPWIIEHSGFNKWCKWVSYDILTHLAGTVVTA